MKLSHSRAAAVKAYLVEHGVTASRIQTDGKGMTELINPANPRAAENRRVEVVAKPS
jgi:outer membrane protein OmpA-like peptidoglycan-associated protein